MIDKNRSRVGRGVPTGGQFKTEHKHGTLLEPMPSESLPNDDDQPSYISENGDKCWVNSEGKFDREGAPAVIEADGTKRWYKNGELDREGAPAVEYPDGGYEYYSHGQLHNEWGPAARYYFPFANKSVEIWYVHGERHREGAPAVVWSNGETEWYFRGEHHREGGPAIETNFSAARDWYIHGKLIPGPVVEDIMSQCSELEKLPHFSGTTFEGECVIYHFGKSAAIAVEKAPEGEINVLYSYNRLKSDASRLDAAFKMVEELNREKAN